MDLTRTIQRKKEKELAALQFVGGDSTTAQKPVIAKERASDAMTLPVRQREEVQKMPRSLKTRGRNVASGRLAGNPSFCFRGAAQPAIFPDHLGVYQKSAPKTIGIPDKELYDEYGLEATESADYTSPDKKHFSATAWRLHDSTGALALFDPAPARRGALRFCSVSGANLRRHYLRFRELRVPVYGCDSGPADPERAL